MTNPGLREVFGIPLPPGFCVEWDPMNLDVRCEWCQHVAHYSMAGYLIGRVQADALRHRAACLPMFARHDTAERR